MRLVVLQATSRDFACRAMLHSNRSSVVVTSLEFRNSCEIRWHVSLLPRRRNGFRRVFPPFGIPSPLPHPCHAHSTLNPKPVYNQNSQCPQVSSTRFVIIFAQACSRYPSHASADTWRSLCLHALKYAHTRPSHVMSQSRGIALWCIIEACKLP